MLYIQRVPSYFPHPVEAFSAPSREEQYYRQVAAEHRRRADAALALAQQERERAYIARQRQHQHAFHPSMPQSSYRHSCYAPSWQDEIAAMIAERERQAEAYQQEQDRKRKEREEALGRLGQERAGPQAPDFLLSLLSALEHDLTTEEPVEQPRKKQVRFTPETEVQPAVEAVKVDAKGKAKVPSIPIQLAARKPTSRPTSEPIGDAWSQLFSALNGGPTVADKERTLQALGFKLPPTARPAPTKPAKARPASVNIPTTRSTPAPSAPAPATASPRDTSFSTLSTVQTTFDAVKSSFSFPSELEFDAASTAEDIKLTYSSTNASVHQYEQELMKLLTKLDGVDSDGAESVRGARKALVLAVEAELESLDRAKREMWNARSKAVEQVSEEAAEEASGVVTTSAEAMDVDVPEAPQVEAVVSSAFATPNDSVPSEAEAESTTQVVEGADIVGASDGPSSVLAEDLEEVIAAEQVHLPTPTAAEEADLVEVPASPTSEVVQVEVTVPSPALSATPSDEDVVEDSILVEKEMADEDRSEKKTDGSVIEEEPHSDFEML